MLIMTISSVISWKKQITIVMEAALGKVLNLDEQTVKDSMKYQIRNLKVNKFNKISINSKSSSVQSLVR